MIGDEITKQYFNKSVQELIDFSKEVNGKELNYGWWGEGMEDFIDSDYSETVQNKAIHDKFIKTFKRYGIFDRGWSTSRQYAIGMSLINSAPKCFLDAGKNMTGMLKK